MALDLVGKWGSPSKPTDRNKLLQLQLLFLFLFLKLLLKLLLCSGVVATAATT